MWSWAVTIAFTGTGELPFKGESLTATAYAILHAEPTIGPLPEPLGSIIHRCLSKNPAFRPSARGALTQLAAAGAQLTGPLPAEAPPLPADAAAYSPPGPVAVPQPRQGSDDGLTGPSAVSEPQPDSRPSGRTRWRWWAAAAAIAILLVAGSVGTARLLAQRGAAPKPPTSGPPGSSPGLGPAAAARAKAVTWIVHQVSPASVVGCDPQVCADLATKGFVSLDPIGSQSTDPLSASLVVATAPIRAQWGARLASVYAPVVIASFGSGNARIDIRWVFPGGTTRYREVQRQDMRTRRTHDALLLTNSQITFSATARKQLLSGDIDPRLPQLLAYMAHGHRLTVVGFGDQSPGGGPASLLRSVDLATADPATRTGSAAYPRWMQRFFRVQRAQYHLAWSHLIRSSTGQTVLNIGYDAPSPLS
jgi:hypothetical protein